MSITTSDPLLDSMSSAFAKPDNCNKTIARLEVLNDDLHDLLSQLDEAILSQASEI